MLAKAAVIAAPAIAAFRNYPVVSAAMITIAVVLIARFGLGAHGDLLTAIVIVMAIVLGGVVQARVTPKAKQDNRAAP